MNALGYLPQCVFIVSSGIEAYEVHAPEVALALIDIQAAEGVLRRDGITTTGSLGSRFRFPPGFFAGGELFRPRCGAGEGGAGLDAIDAQTLLDAVAELPSAEAAVGTPVVELFVALGFEKGVGAARRTLASGGLNMNNAKVTDASQTLTDADVLPGGVVLLRKGKKNLGVIRVNG